MNQLPTVEGIGRGWVEVTPSGHGPTTPYEIRAAASEARRSGDAASMFDVNDTPRNDAPPALTPEPSKVASIVGAVVGAVVGMFKNTNATDGDAAIDADEPLPGTVAECLAATLRVQNEPATTRQAQDARERRVDRLVQHRNRLENAPTVAAPLDRSNDSIWAVLKLSPQVEKAAAAVVVAWRAWDAQMKDFSKAGLLPGTAAEKIRILESEVGNCRDVEALREHSTELGRLKAINRGHEHQAARIVADLFSAIHGPYEALLNAADDSLAKLERQAIVDESNFFMAHGLSREITGVSHRYSKAGQHLKHMRSMLPGFKGQDGSTVIVRRWSPPVELCGPVCR